MAEDETEVQAEEQGPDVSKLLEEKAAEIEARFEEKYKSELAGLNRRISEQDAELKKATAEKETTKKSLEERVREIEQESRRKDDELRKERLVRQLHAEAEKRGLVLEDELPLLDKMGALSLEDGIAVLDKRKESYEKKVTEEVTKHLNINGHKPGGGSVGDETRKLPDPNDMSLSNRKRWEEVVEKGEADKPRH